MKLYFTDLSPATAYRITVTAVDNFGNESEPQEITFTTGGDKTDLPDELPEGFEEGLLVDMKFENSLEDEADADSQNVSRETYHMRTASTAARLYAYLQVRASTWAPERNWTAWEPTKVRRTASGISCTA